MKTTRHTINFTNAAGQYVKKVFFTRAGLVSGLKRELRKIELKRGIVKDPVEIKRLEKSAQTVKSILEMYNENSEVNRGIEKAYETR